ncbi:MAG: CRISPR-associated ring nuclease Csm6 [Pseudomonadota bacterium]|nr:CRISPR-associated ring nuclease Csm6 [Pseudomonadota bacterium]
MGKKQEEPGRCILLAVTGLSPQIVTETLYALVVRKGAAHVPTEVRLVTTAEGADRARLNLLHAETGWFHRFRRDYDVPDIHFDEDCIETLADGRGRPLHDIRTPSDNRHAADALTRAVRDLTSDPDCTLHVSIAGGRKTLGYYAGYALSLFGRPRDRLSHVLVSAPFESHPDFYYPTPESRVIHTPPPERRPLDTREAQVTLAEIPFVRLREGLPRRLLKGQATFSDTVAAAQRAMQPPSLEIDPGTRRIVAGEETVALSPADFAFYVWMAHRRATGKQPVHWGDAGIGEEYLAEYAAVVGEYSGDYERAEAALRNEILKDWFEQRKSRTNTAIRSALGEQLAHAYLITGSGQRPTTRFGLALPPEAILFSGPKSE